MHRVDDHPHQLSPSESPSRVRSDRGSSYDSREELKKRRSCNHAVRARSTVPPPWLSPVCESWAAPRPIIIHTSAGVWWPVDPKRRVSRRLAHSLSSPPLLHLWSSKQGIANHTAAQRAPVASNEDGNRLFAPHCFSLCCSDGILKVKRMQTHDSEGTVCRDWGFFRSPLSSGHHFLQVTTFFRSPLLLYCFSFFFFFSFFFNFNFNFGIC
jgi:hypothetical protein